VEFVLKVAAVCSSERWYPHTTQVVIIPIFAAVPALNPIHKFVAMLIIL
jgi:hypothetical protein